MARVDPEGHPATGPSPPSSTAELETLPSFVKLGFRGTRRGSGGWRDRGERHLIRLRVRARVVRIVEIFGIRGLGLRRLQHEGPRDWKPGFCFLLELQWSKLSQWTWGM